MLRGFRSIVSKTLLLSSFLFCFGSWAFSADSIRIALIGEGEKVDAAAAGLSSDDRIELLERNRIREVLQEHGLNAAGLSAGHIVKHLPHADVIAVFTPERLVVFNAKNGFRLWDGKPDNPAPQIQFAIAKREREEPLYLSIVSVRNIGIPQAAEPKMEELITRLEQQLIQSAAIQILERERLGMVREERDLTEKHFSLLPSARLLSFEFEPGRDDQVIVRLFVRDTSGKLLHKCEVKDGFRDLSSSALSLRTQLDPALFGSQKQAGTGKKEAARYFQEFTALRKSKYNLTPECTSKLEAALALDPDNPKYRYAEIEYRAELIKDLLPYSRRVAEWPAQWERCRRFRDQFSIKVWPIRVMFPCNILPGLDYSETRPGTADYALAETILAQVRIYGAREDRDSLGVPDSKEEVADLKVIKLLTVFYFEYLDDLYISFSRYLREKLQQEREFFQIVEDYLKKHPEQVNEVNQALGGYYQSTNVRSCCGWYSPNRREILAAHLNSPMVAEHLEFLSRSRLPNLKRAYIVLKHMRKMAAGPCSEADFRVGLQDLFKELDSIFPNDLSPEDSNCGGQETPWLWYKGNIRDFTKYMLGRDNVYFWELKRFQRENKNLDPWSAFRDAINSDPSELLHHVETMRSRRYERMIHNDIGNLYVRIPSRIFKPRGDFAGEAAEKLFREVNSDFEIRTGLYSDLWNAPFLNLETLLGAVRSGSRTWLLFRRIRQGRSYPPLILACLNDDGTTSPYIETPIEGSAFTGREVLIGAGQSAPVACDSRYIAIADLKRNIHIYDLETKHWSLISEAAPSVITDLAIAFGRIWGINSSDPGKIQAEFCMMFSCAMDGSDRRIHFSTARSNPQNELDGMRIRQVSSLIVSGKNLFFTVTGERNTSVYRFSPETDEFSCIVKFPFKGEGIDHLWVQKNGLYCCTMGFGERIYRIDTERKSAEWIFNQTGKKYKFDPPDANPVNLEGGSSEMNHPWAFHGNFLYSANWKPGAIRLNNVKESPLFLLPKCIYLFETDKGVLFLGYHRYFFVKEKVPAESTEDVKQ